LTKGDTPEGGLTPINDFPELIGKLDKDEEKPTVNSNQVAVSQSPTNLLQQAVHMQKQSAEGLMSLLRIAGKAYSHLTSYESRLVLDAVELFSPRHRRSSWVLSLMAKAYFELADYKQAAK
jgi:anaphase-promoting complex subunit 3